MNGKNLYAYITICISFSSLCIEQDINQTQYTHALHTAVLHLDEAEVSRLLERGADKNAVDSQGKTPLNIVQKRIGEDKAALMHLTTMLETARLTQDALTKVNKQKEEYEKNIYTADQIIKLLSKEYR